MYAHTHILERAAAARIVTRAACAARAV
jgi:hypothetical protein